MGLRLVVSRNSKRSCLVPRRQPLPPLASSTSSIPSSESLNLAAQLDQLRRTRPNTVAAIERLVHFYCTHKEPME